jgi:multicomponent Na+:H+ antiporter subunit C
MHHLFQTFPYFIAAWLLCCGLYGLITSRNLVHSVVCLAILQSSTYVLLLAIGYRKGGAAPIFADWLSPGQLTVDPVVQALMLTDVVVEAVVVALLLAMVVKAHEKAGSVSPDDLRTMRQ